MERDGSQEQQGDPQPTVMPIAETQTAPETPVVPAERTRLVADPLEQPFPKLPKTDAESPDPNGTVTRDAETGAYTWTSPEGVTHRAENAAAAIKVCRKLGEVAANSPDLADSLLRVMALGSMKMTEREKPIADQKSDEPTPAKKTTPDKAHDAKPSHKPVKETQPETVKPVPPPPSKVHTVAPKSAEAVDPIITDLKNEKPTRPITPPQPVVETGPKPVATEHDLPITEQTFTAPHAREDTKARPQGRATPTTKTQPIAAQLPFIPKLPQFEQTNIRTTSNTPRITPEVIGVTQNHGLSEATESFSTVHIEEIAAPIPEKAGIVADALENPIEYSHVETDQDNIVVTEAIQPSNVHEDTIQNIDSINVEVYEKPINSVVLDAENIESTAPVIEQDISLEIIQGEEFVGLDDETDDLNDLENLVVEENTIDNLYGPDVVKNSEYEEDTVLDEADQQWDVEQAQPAVLETFIETLEAAIDTETPTLDVSETDINTLELSETSLAEANHDSDDAHTELQPVVLQVKRRLRALEVRDTVLITPILQDITAKITSMKLGVVEPYRETGLEESIAPRPEAQIEELVRQLFITLDVEYAEADIQTFILKMMQTENVSSLTPSMAIDLETEGTREAKYSLHAVADDELPEDNKLRQLLGTVSLWHANNELYYQAA